MYCSECDKNISTVDIVNQSLQRLRDAIIPSNKAQLNRPATNIPLSPERLDMAAYTFLYHMNGGCALETDSFWGYIHVQETLFKYRWKNIHLVTVHPASRKVASVDSCCLLCIKLVHTFTRIKETTIRTKHCGTP